jgi:hypothetical protein
MAQGRSSNLRWANYKYECHFLFSLKKYMIRYVLNFISTVRHKIYVASYLIRFSLRMIWRGLLHDNSKFRSDEFRGYASVIDNLSNSTYGSVTYNTNKNKIRHIINLHYSRNDHHPEHHENFQFMNLEDITEMFFDWVSSAKRHKDGNVVRSIIINQDRFGIPKKLTNIFLNTVRDLVGIEKYETLYEKALHESSIYQKIKTITYSYGGKEKRINLKPCPNPDCCSNGLQLSLHRNFDYISCSSCGMSGPVFDGHPDDAIEGWNDLPRE